ncbi:Ribosomal RNA small subunit methyltransferase H [Hyphomicrobium sp. 1Nfss2.1]
MSSQDIEQLARMAATALRALGPTGRQRIADPFIREQVRILRQIDIALRVARGAQARIPKSKSLAEGQRQADIAVEKAALARQLADRLVQMDNARKAAKPSTLGEKPN